jgi:hypothetical protein
MKIINPIAVADANLLASNVPENDEAEWDVSTTYAASDRVMVTTDTHRIYESVQGGNLGNDPISDDGTWWIEVSATNRWKAFDGVIADQVSNSGTITYSMSLGDVVTGVVFFGLNAASVQVEVYDDDSPANLVYDEEINLVDDSDIVDWFTFFTTTLERYETEALFANVPAYPGYQIDITVGDGTGTAEVGEICFGRIVTLGMTLEGTNIGLRSFSTKTQDDFGNWTIVSRAKSDPIDFTFAMNASDAGRVKRELNRLRDTPAVYFADEELTHLGAVTYGLFQDYEIPLVGTGKSIVNLEIEGLT